MLNKIKKYFIKSKDAPTTKEEEKKQKVSREAWPEKKRVRTVEDATRDMEAKCIQRVAPQLKDKDGLVIAQDSLLPNPFNMGQLTVPVTLIDWYANQNFIGYPFCAMLAQDWLINKCCTIPAKDAIRKGFSVTKNDGEEIEAGILDEIRCLDINYKLDENLVEFIRFSKIYGIRLALFNVESDDPYYYENPFNIDGVTPGSYRGISQIDPYWISPELDAEALTDPKSMHFYEPTWWIINGDRIHRSHFAILIPEPVPDVLKPTYFYGGIPLTQKLYQRIYCAERTANEGPLLAMTKRTDVLTMDTAQGLAQQESLEAQILRWQLFRDNFGTKIIGLDETYQQFDTSLADLDSTIMTQYQLCAAISNMPSSKLLGTSPKGFNATGEYEESNYHEDLESTQMEVSALVNRHHQLVIKSDICPIFKCDYFETEITWNKLDAMTEKELAEVNKIRAETDVMLASTGAINGEDIRKNKINDPGSGYNGLEELDQENIDLNLEEENLGDKVTEKIVV